MKRRIRAAVVGGGQNCEHDVSLASAAAAADGLQALGYDVIRLTVDRDGGWRDATGRSLGLPEAVGVLGGCDVVLPMMHGPRGEDGTLAALLDMIGVPYVGSGVRAGALAMDKWATKLVAGALGIATAPGMLCTAATAAGYSWTRPVVIKPVAAGSSHGVCLVDAADQLPAALDAALALDDRILIEDVVAGREIDVAVLGGAAGIRFTSPPLEVVTHGLFDFASKYGGTAQFRIPAPLDEADLKALESAALAMYEALGCRGVARIDFFLTESGPVLNEVNTAPGFTPHSQVPRMFAAIGTSYTELLAILVHEALSGYS